MRSLKEMDDLVTRLSEAKAEESEQRRIYSEKTKAVEEIEGEIMKELTLQGLDSFKASKGMVYISEKYAVKFPTDLDVKAQLFQYLKDRGAFDAMWSINYATLNAFFKQEVERAKENGELVDVPGLNPLLTKTLNHRKG